MSTGAAYSVRRRPRLCKTCLPCRASKVRCDRKEPCTNCAKRNFTCSYSRAPLSTVAPLPSPSPLNPTTAHHQQRQQQELAQPPYSTATPSSVPSVRFSPDKNTSQRYNYNTPTNVTTTPSHGDNGYSGVYSRNEYADSQDSLSSSSSDPVNISQAEWDEIHNKMGTMEHILASLHSLFRSHSGRRKRPNPPRQEDNDNGEETTRGETQQKPHPNFVSRTAGYRSNPLKSGPIHIGSRSALVDILDKSNKSDDTARALPKDDLLAELALGNQSVAYPFVDLWSSDPFTFNIAAVCSVLPTDEQCHRYAVFLFLMILHTLIDGLGFVSVDFLLFIKILGLFYTLFFQMSLNSNTTCTNCYGIEPRQEGNIGRMQTGW